MNQHLLDCIYKQTVFFFLKQHLKVSQEHVLRNFIIIPVLYDHKGATGVNGVVSVLAVYYQRRVLLCKHYLTWVCLLAGEKVETFPVIEIDQKDIVDTNGAGDAFVGGTVPSGLNRNACYSPNWTIVNFPPCSLDLIYYTIPSGC